MKFGSDVWLLKKAKQENGSSTSVGGSRAFIYVSTDPEVTWVGCKLCSFDRPFQVKAMTGEQVLSEYFGGRLDVKLGVVKCDECGVVLYPK
jgi:hypothetical protein